MGSADLLKPDRENRIPIYQARFEQGLGIFDGEPADPRGAGVCWGCGCLFVRESDNQKYCNQRCHRAVINRRKRMARGA